MASVSVERLDHLGVIAEVIKGLSLIDMIDVRLGPEAQEVITPGEAVAGMVLNGLGFATRPLSLTPQFFANKPLDLLFHEGLRAEALNRFKLGRTLDEVYVYGCGLLFSELALAAVAKRWTYHQVDAYTLLEHKRYGRKGRPTPTSPIKVIEWQIQGHVRPEVDDIERRKQSQACFVLGTNIDERQVSDAEVIRAYKGQGQTEGGFRFLKDPLLFVSSLFVKKPSRIQGLLTVMTIALLVYSVAQRHLRQQ